jgi:CheY-like chemotaxis protein
MPHSRLFALRPRDAPQEAPPDARGTAPRRVLIVEDDDAICSSLGEALRERGFDVSTASNGREALERLRGAPPPSAIVLDLMMPVMDGWDFRQEQLQDPALRPIPVVVVTAAGFSSESIRTQFGNVVLISKPVPILDLVDALGRACDPTSSSPA